MKDFTLHSYEQLLRKIGPRDCTLLHYLTNNDIEYIIRHDVDKSLDNALKMARIESQNEIKSSYYFRVKPNLFNKDIINKIYTLGHEIGYHYEIMDKAKGDLISAKKLFKEEWSLFKEWNSKTVAMHGNPLTIYNNLDFWKNNKLSDYDIMGEAYLSVDFNSIKYFTDTGRGWNTSVSFKDKGNKELIKIDSNSTRNLIEYIIIWAINPKFPSDWRLENVLTVIFITLLVITRRRFRLSNVSYTVLFVFMLLHTVGAHYTYAEVPYENWFATLGVKINELLGFQRNNFDRLVHFSFGFLFFYPVRELFMRVANTRGAWSYYLPLELVMSLSMLYELMEWGAAVMVGGDLGMAYLGTQGDVWDSHKDMGLATLGAAIAMVIVAIINWRLQHDFMSEMVESLKVKVNEPLGEVKLREYLMRRKRGEN